MLNGISVHTGSYMELDPHDPLAGGCVKIKCPCGFSSYADCEDDGSNIRGECTECSTSFETLMY